MQTTVPQVGKTYVSQVDPTLSMYVEDILVVAHDECGDGGFLVTCRSHKNKGEPDAPCCEILDDEWEEFQFVQVAA